MAYGLIYTFSFQDQIFEAPAIFRVEIAKKDYTGVVFILPFMAESPAIMERVTDDENKLTAIIGTKLTLGMVYDGVSVVPHPNTFKNIQEDEYSVIVYKNEVVNFRGFIKPDATSYAFANAPLVYNINATDYFNGMKSKIIDLDVGGSFYYGHISIADFIGRTVFRAVDYTDAKIKVLSSIRPAEMSLTRNFVNGLFLHTDSFYDIEEGPMKIYNALLLFLQSFRARIFFAEGTYWIQRIAQLYYPYDSVIMYEYPFTVIDNFPVNSHVHYKQDFLVIEGTGNISVSPAIYSQKANYKLKGLNQIRNFTWMEFTPPRTVDEWDVFSTYNVERVGQGSAGDPYRLRVFEPSPGEGTSSMRQLVTNVLVGQRVQFQLNLLGNYAKDIAVGVLLGSTTDPGNAYVLDSGGNWIRYQQGSTVYLFFPISLPKIGQTQVNIISAPIPEYVNNYPLTVFIAYPRPIDGGAPVGEQTYVEVYPPFLRLFTSDVTDVESTTTNDKVFSYIPEKQELFYLDTGDELLSNTVYTDNGSAIVPVPLDNWTDDGLPLHKTLDYFAGETILDNFSLSSNVFEGDIRSNTLEYYQSIVIGEIDDGTTFMQISDVYDMRTGIHKIVAHQVYPKAFGDGTYTVKNIINS